MKGSIVALGTFRGRDLAAHVVDGVLEDLLVAPPDDTILPGAIYRARLGRPMKGQGGAFLETPDGPLFLRQTKGLSPGDTFLVKVSGFAERGKAPQATTRILLKSRYVIATPDAPGINISRSIRDEDERLRLHELLADVALPPMLGLVIRSAAESASDADILDDCTATVELARLALSEKNSGTPELLVEGPDPATQAWRDWPQPDQVESDDDALAHFGVVEAIEAALQAEVPLSGSATCFIEPTRALVAVDVNTGNDSSPAAGLKANMAAIRDLPRQLRLRGLGGQIVLDLAPFPKRDRRQLEQCLRVALKSDPIETAFVGWTPLGHMELQRKRERIPLSEALR